MKRESQRNRGVPVAITSALLLGFAPIFGKQAIDAGMFSISVVAARTAGAALLLFLVVLIFQRRYLYIYPVGLLGCVIAGALNGLGSIFFYVGLSRIDASLSQLLYALYPVFVALLLYLDGLRHSRITIITLAMSMPAVYLLTQASTTEISIMDIAFPLLSGLLYAIHIPINQRVLYEAPAPTVTLYTLFAMTLVVVPASMIFAPSMPDIPDPAVLPLLLLTLVTFFSRLTLFSGVKSIGGMRTSLLGLAELLVTIGLAHLWLGESLTTHQWLGAILLAAALILVGGDKSSTTTPGVDGWLHWLRPRFRQSDARPISGDTPPHPLSPEGAEGADRIGDRNTVVD